MPSLPYAAQALDPRRLAYAAELAQGTDRFQEPRRQDCPWCGSDRLCTRLRAPDLLQHKPGSFAVDQCRDCGHAFQNPRLTAEGLAFYHRDLGDDEPRGLAERLLAAGRSHRLHRAVARLMRGVGEPESWLDVGTGHARFPHAAREVFPYTSFDGLDPTMRVVRARAAGRVEEAHVGHLADPHLAARLRARYDVVSMFQHLARVPDPRAELGAALAALRPGGHLLIELPDPRSAFARLLGRWWLSHGQPRQLHLLPLRNLRAELRARGCTVLVVDRRTAHTPHDLSAALALALTHVLPAADVPWCTEPPGDLQRLLRTALTGAAGPLLAVAAALDHVLAPLLRHTPFANTYRVVARRDTG
ncbi:class I SAM-dependent methyltransferase [Streptomyces tropicalis]|uniref:Class I SAM-dependent methyltransferase n=1 Tax=Streptomyces tropicalis TaxID=3034234 RepID=A0ABT5ZXQ9_9ACTN|nr:class I SAM-dependent methyltransferase [Streptomyces tropicalis]MDF3297181.1 class I SAM-dependent methyltransferase [Streptomyces tropicalis]